MVSHGITSEKATIIIMGASGDLTARKLMPSLFALCTGGYLHEETRIIGVARREKTSESWRDEMKESVQKRAADEFTEENWTAFADRVTYFQLDLMDPAAYAGLREFAEADNSEPVTTIVYMATSPSLFEPCIESLADAGMVPSRTSDRILRVVFEKPFGHDLKSAQELNKSIGRRLSEDQIYRIDHYLGKETVQNILFMRFGNTIFEPLLNRSQVDSVQITVAESIGMEGGRGAFYDKTGALRDVLQNHVLQVLCLIAMDPPALFQAREIRDEKMKVLQALRPGADSIDEWAMRGQYVAGEVEGVQVP
ncbi:MAG: glucose-6-phosphate dehydrogenase, partial [Planctomycetaceae bacterium]